MLPAAIVGHITLPVAPAPSTESDCRSPAANVSVRRQLFGNFVNAKNDPAV
jgi:hypothetical protein